MIDKKDQIINLRKNYLDQIEKFDSKIYFTFLSFSISLIILNFKFGIVLGVSNLLLILGVFLFLTTTTFLEFTLDKRRKKAFNDLIKEIKMGDVKEIK